jgi:hypothetical protein
MTRPNDARYKANWKKSIHKIREYKGEDYERLPSQHGAIRLLKLLPHTTTTSEVHCELLTPKEGDEFKNKHEYEALSWCWGTDREGAVLHIRSKGMNYVKKISPNLLAALQALRYPNRDRYLWIDAVCINVSGMVAYTCNSADRSIS